MKQENVIFTPNNVGNLFIVYKLDKWLQDLNTDFTVKDCLFGNVKITKNSNPDKYCYSGYEIEFDSCSLFSIPNFDWSKKVTVFGVDMSSSVHIDNENKDILILGKWTTQELENTTLTAETEIFYYSFKITKNILFKSSL